MTVNAMKISPSQAYDALMQGWRAQDENGLKMSYMLHGEPGVGKTHIVEALARDIGAHFYDVRLTTIDVSDLRGLPYYDHETKTTQWYRPEDLPREDEAPSILFLDELTSASPYLQPTVYGLLQERRVGKHKIPDNVMIIAAGNGTADGAVAYEMGTAIANRLIHMVVTQEAESWVDKFAIPNDIHPAVTAFIKASPGFLHTIQMSLKNDDLIAATGRSWERVSNIMKFVKDRQTQRIMIAGTVGEAIAAEFFIVADDVAATVNVFKMVKTPREKRAPMYPSTLHGLNAMVFGLIGYAKEENLYDCIEIMADLVHIKDKRSEKEFRKFPLGELATHGFEALMSKAIKGGMTDLFINSPAYQAYHEERKELGLVA
jgi:DNA polymerase III delta prime subunit